LIRRFTMLRRQAVAGLVSVIFFLVGAQYAYSEAKAPQSPPQKKDAKELVLRIKNASVEELKKLSFLELNFLKNAVYASKGYRFADDRPWLNQIFCEQRWKGVKKKGLSALQAKIDSWTSQLRKDAPWNLDVYAFPSCREGGELDQEQMKALANIRVALFKKIDSLGAIAAIDARLSDEIKRLPREGEFVWMLGKAVPLCTAGGCVEQSVRRELHGYNRLLQLIKNTANFDAMELLGLYMGDILFVRYVIEAKYGRPFDSVLGWEISQIIGVTEKKADYDAKKLPVNIQVVLQLLDGIVQNILQSDLSDVPASLRGKKIEFFTPYNGGAC